MKLPAALLACTHLDALSPALARALDIDPARFPCWGLVTADQDDALYIALDQATKHARVDVVFARSFYAGARHASGPFSGEAIGILGAADPDDIAEALWTLPEHLARVCFETLPGPGKDGAGQTTWLAEVVSETGSYLSHDAGVALGAPIAYLIAPPLEALMGVDAALKAAHVSLARLVRPPSETNFAGALLSGPLDALGAARDAFVGAVQAVARRPFDGLRKPAHQRRA